MGGESVELRLVENETLRTADLSASQAAQLRERYSDHVTVQPDWEPGSFVLTARQSVGVIALDGLRLRIAPKVPLTNLFYMLTYAYDLPLFRDEAAPLRSEEHTSELQSH